MMLSVLYLVEKKQFSVEASLIIWKCVEMIFNHRKYPELYTEDFMLGSFGMALYALNAISATSTEIAYVKMLRDSTC